MKILIELPTWLGDTIMATPAIENLVSLFNNLEITLIGSDIAIEALKNHPRVFKTYVLEKNYLIFFKTLRGLIEYDIFLSFRGSFRTKFMKFCISSKSSYQYDKKKYPNGHQVEKYNNFISDVMKNALAPGKLKLHTKIVKSHSKNKILGINPGASYGSSKRWYPEEFAKVAIGLSSDYDIVIFGSSIEKNIATDIENYLIKKGVSNYQNLSAQTSIHDLIAHISNLDLFITGDSGPMHIAAAYQIPTVSIFGSTNDKETSQWMNEDSIIVKKNLNCQPCMKRVCPLKHHNCMKLITALDVLKAAKQFD